MRSEDDGSDDAEEGSDVADVDCRQESDRHCKEEFFESKLNVFQSEIHLALSESHYLI